VCVDDVVVVVWLLLIESAKRPNDAGNLMMHGACAALYEFGVRAVRAHEAPPRLAKLRVFRGEFFFEFRCV
jgi:hypothetical protein